MEDVGGKDGASALSATAAAWVGIPMGMARTVAYEGGGEADVRGTGFHFLRHLSLLPHARGGAVCMGLLALLLRPDGTMAAAVRGALCRLHFATGDGGHAATPAGGADAPLPRSGGRCTVCPREAADRTGH